MITKDIEIWRKANDFVACFPLVAVVASDDDLSLLCVVWCILLNVSTVWKVFTRKEVLPAVTTKQNTTPKQILISVTRSSESYRQEKAYAIPLLGQKIL
jgi:hypothetical protein